MSPPVDPGKTVLKNSPTKVSRTQASQGVAQSVRESKRHQRVTTDKTQRRINPKAPAIGPGSSRLKALGIPGLRVTSAAKEALSGGVAGECGSSSAKP
jgi:hypothetical protein